MNFKWFLILLLLPNFVSAQIDKDYITHRAWAFGVDPDIALHIIENESKFNPDAIGDTTYRCRKTGKISPSYGLVQINGCFHDYPKEMLLDPDFSLDFLLTNLAQGRCKLWSTCPTSSG